MSYFSHERMLLRQGRRQDPALWSATSAQGMVATAHYLATKAGVEMLALGGNAIDAAVAASLALGVCEPAGSGLGGTALMLVHLAGPGRTFGLIGSCRAPGRATPEGVSQGSRYRSHRAIAIPTNPAVLDRALSRYGTLSRSEVFGPAIRYAEQGYPISPLQQGLLKHFLRPLRRGRTARRFLTEERRPHDVGTFIRQPELAATLRRLCEAGFADFYRGEIARLISEDMERNGGFLRLDDLENLKAPEETEPLRGVFGSREVYTTGPPAGGVSLLQMLNVLRRAADRDLALDAPAGATLLAAVIRRSRQDRRGFRLKTRATELGGAAELLTEDYARVVAAELALGGDGSGETSHVSIVDAQGNMVSMTQSLERNFGAAVMHPELGFLYNGFLRAFKVLNPNHPHFLRPGAVARSNASPTILLEEGKAWAAIGNTGSERSASGIVQVLARLRTQSPFEAVLAPRLHCTPESIVYLEQERFPPETVSALSAKGYDVRPLEPYSMRVGGLNLVVRQGNEFCGVTDPRRDGAAAGPESLQESS